MSEDEAAVADDVVRLAVVLLTKLPQLLAQHLEEERISISLASRQTGVSRHVLSTVMNFDSTTHLTISNAIRLIEWMYL